MLLTLLHVSITTTRIFSLYFGRRGQNSPILEKDRLLGVENHFYRWVHGFVDDYSTVCFKKICFVSQWNIDDNVIGRALVFIGTCVGTKIFNPCFSRQIFAACGVSGNGRKVAEVVRGG